MQVRRLMHMPVRGRMHMQVRRLMHMPGRARVHMPQPDRLHMPDRGRMHMPNRGRVNLSRRSARGRAEAASPERRIDPSLGKPFPGAIGIRARPWVLSLAIDQTRGAAVAPGRDRRIHVETPECPDQPGETRPAEPPQLAPLESRDDRLADPGHELQSPLRHPHAIPTPPDHLADVHQPLIKQVVAVVEAEGFPAHERRVAPHPSPAAYGAWRRLVAPGGARSGVVAPDRAYAADMHQARGQLVGG